MYMQQLAQATHCAMWPCRAVGRSENPGGGRAGSNLVGIICPSTPFVICQIFWQPLPPCPSGTDSPAMERVCNCDECWGIPSGCNFDWLRLVSRLQMCDRKVIDGSRMFILRKTDWMKYFFGHLWAKSKMKWSCFCDSVLKTNIWLRFLRIMHFYANQIGFWKSNEGQAFETTASLSQSDNFCNPTTFLGVSLYIKEISLSFSIKYLAYFIEFQFRSLNILSPSFSILSLMNCVSFSTTFIILEGLSVYFTTAFITWQVLT